MSLDSMRVFTSDGVDVFDVFDEDERTTVSQHWNAIKAFLGSGDVELFEPFEDARVAGRRLQTDAGEIEVWAYQGDLDFEDIYTS